MKLQHAVPSGAAAAAGATETSASATKTTNAVRSLFIGYLPLVAGCENGCTPREDTASRIWLIPRFC